MVNARELEEIIPVLRELEEAEKFNMSYWAEGILNPNADSVTTCGTQFCMAGAKAYYDGWLPQWEPIIKHVRNPKTRKFEEITIKRATGEFLDPDDAAMLGHPGCDEEVNAETIGIDAFELRSELGHVEFLFHGTHITRVEDLERRIRWVIEHPTAYTREYPAEFFQLEKRHQCEDERRRGVHSTYHCDICPDEDDDDDF